ncbi:MAG: HAD family hydrolase [Patescibacteria group bacterium]
MSDTIELIQFDWSGTLSDDRPTVYESHVRMCQYYGIESQKTIEEWYRTATGIPRDYQKPGVTDSPEQIWNLYKKIFLEVLADGIHPTIFPDVKDTIQELKAQGKKLVVISSHPQKYLHQEAKMYGIIEYFDEIRGSIPFNKSTEIRAMYTRLGVHPDNTLYVGDMVSDILAAREANVRSIALTRGYHTQEKLQAYKPFFLWDDLSPIKDL